MPIIKCGSICGVDHQVSDHDWLQKLYESPEVASTALQAFHSQGRKRDEIRLADDLHILLKDVSLPEGYYQRLWETDLPVVLITLLLDETSWEDSVPATDLHNHFIGCLLCCSFWLATKLTQLKHYKTGAGKECTAKMLQLSPQLWRLLWKRRDWLWDPERRFNFNNGKTGLRNPVNVNYMAMLALKQFGQLQWAFNGGQDIPDILWTDEGRIALYAWSRGLESEDLEVDMIEIFFPRIDIFEGGGEFFKEVVVETGILPEFLSTLKTVLMRPHTLNRQLLGIMNLMYPALQGGDDLVEKRPEPLEEIGLLEAIVFSLQRQHCCGLAAMSSDIQVYAMAAISVLLQRPPLPHIKVAIEKVDQLSLLTLSARIWPDAAARNDIRWIEMIKPILDTYGAMGMARFAFGPHAKELANKITDAARRVWLPVLRQLRTLKLPPGSPWLDDWLKFGQEMNFKERYEPKLYERFISAPQDVPRKHCQWKGCLCCDKRPKHPMRICTGCYRVFYCSARCQRSDWKNGEHRDKCNGRKR